MISIVIRVGHLAALPHGLNVARVVQREQDGHLRLASFRSELTCFLFRGRFEISTALRVSFPASLRFWILALLLNGGFRSEA